MYTDAQMSQKTLVQPQGRLCNQIIRNLAVSIIAKTTDLNVEYSSADRIVERLGIPLFVGSKLYQNTIYLTDNNYMEILKNTYLANFITHDYYQTRDISHLIYDHLREPDVKTSITGKNPYRSRYDNNQDCFIHIRLGDVVQWSPGLEYYKSALDRIPQKGRIFIGSDSPDHEIVRELCETYGATVYDADEVDTLQFGSTCRYLILSHGSYSAVMGWMAYGADSVYYPAYIDGKVWYGDMFSLDDKGWIKIERC